MSFIAALTLAASATTTVPACSWDRPGVNPFMGDVVAAVDRYTDIPVAVRERLKKRMRERSYDEIAVIGRDGIHGKAQYGAEIRDMHFGRGSICRTVTRQRWSATHQERGLVYCEDGQCILVPTVCRNVSRITRVGPKPVAGAAQDDGAPVQEAEAPLVFDPPAAGGDLAPQPAPSFASVSTEPLGLELAPSTTPLSVAPSIGSPNSPGITQPPSLPGGIGLPPLPPGGGTELPPVTPAVPEPATWLMMALGLGWLMRQRLSKGAR